MAIQEIVKYLGCAVFLWISYSAFMVWWNFSKSIAIGIVVAIILTLIMGALL